jgi:hypothetical protein
MLRRDLGADVTLEAGPYGSFKVSVGDETVVDGGPLAFLGVLPTLDEIRTRVAAHLHVGSTEEPKRDA